MLWQRNVELIVTVVDDGSPDEGAVSTVVKAFCDPRVRLIRHDRPRGVSAARNTGIGATASEWLAFCDDDDVWAPEKLQAQLAAAATASAGWAYGGDVAIDTDLRALHGAPPPAPGQLMVAMSHYNPVPAGSSNVVVRRSALDRVGWFDESLRSVPDWDMWIRLARDGGPACAPQPLVGCRVHGPTITRNRQLMLAEVAIVAARYHLPVDRARHFRWAAWNSMLEGRRFEAMTHYARAIGEGDVASIARLTTALLYPGIARRRAAQPLDAWARSAQAWLDVLRQEVAGSTHGN
jgi:glycosyltransferase involved in cell wall biosynthesis